DIPEGGSKAVLVLKPGGHLDSAARAFPDGILDLTLPHPSIINHYGAPEYIYLGPDEKVTVPHICWISQRAFERGYPFPSTFISSKPGAGINHKEYGVTSEGVQVFLDVGLRFLGLGGEGGFTVKITGGPDGDVAGNMLKIMHREYGTKAKVVGIADGFGVAEDPDGLDHEELLRLVKEGLPIIHFSPAKLGVRGRILAASTPEGAKARNTMHFRIPSDVFVPAGG
ncbi:hypothetical protein HK102_010445, partial [Quaeritorhiza haematococci]